AYLAHSMLFVNNLAYNGSEEQKTRILPKVCSGEWIGAMAMSDPDAGTDVLGLSTTAEKNSDGDWVLNGRKMWITNGCIDDQGTPADIVWVYARTGYDEKGRVKLSTFLVEKGMPGFSVGQKIFDKTGMRASNTAELIFDDCVVPAGNLVGEEGGSLLHMMGNLEIERLTLAGMSVGIARRCLHEMNKYASEREAFGVQIRSFGQMQRHIGESWAKYRAMRAYVYDTANNIQLGKSGQRLDSDGVKLFATTAAKEIADAAIQVMGGYGYVAEYHVERLWRDSKLLEIGGGTLESHQKNITRDLAKDSEAINR
ncbi:MAG: acyl-CoA dehydrogenase family protein, partial [Candidatus Thermoplasmatota archaeon]|nr:acyl-CoA dehydrogenase family protein [Candidatus Thermoplasmatota archaeon]